MSPRFIFFHKQSTSARTRFLRLAHGVCCFEPLPGEARLRPAAEGEAATVALHPAEPLRAAAERLGLPPEKLQAETGFQAWAEGGGEEIPVVLVQFATLDPPFAEAEASGGRFIAITEARGLPAAELELLRRAYEHIMG